MKKVKLAIFDKDLKARKVGYFEVTESGEQIKVKSGGEGHFMPHFDNSSYIDFPKPWYKGGGWEHTYMVRKGAKHCVSFEAKPPIITLDKDGKEIETINPNIDVDPPDPQLVIDTANNIMLNKLGDQKQESPWIQWLLIALVGLDILLQLGVLR